MSMMDDDRLIHIPCFDANDKTVGTKLCVNITKGVVRGFGVHISDVLKTSAFEENESFLFTPISERFSPFIFRQQIRVFGKFPLMSQWRIHQDQHLDLLRQNYLVFLVLRSSVCLARRC